MEQTEPVEQHDVQRPNQVKGRVPQQPHDQDAAAPRGAGMAIETGEQLDESAVRPGKVSTAHGTPGGVLGIPEVGEEDVAAEISEKGDDLDGDRHE